MTRARHNGHGYTLLPVDAGRDSNGMRDALILLPIDNHSDTAKGIEHHHE